MWSEVKSVESGLGLEGLILMQLGKKCEEGLDNIVGKKLTMWEECCEKFVVDWFSVECLSKQ